MNPRFSPIVVAVSGVLCFCLGVWLRFHAVAVGTATIRAGNPFGDMSATMTNSARASAIYDVAIPLLWVGGLLVVLAAAVLLIPAWRLGSDTSAPTRAA